MTGKTERALEDWTNYTKNQFEKYESEQRVEKIFNKPVKSFLEQEFRNYLNEKILDVGSGLFSETYLPEGYDVHCVDWLPHSENKKNRYICNAESLPFEDNSFGVVLSKQVYGYLINPKKCLDEMVRVLKPDGLLTLIDWEGNLKGRNSRVENFDPQKITGQIKLMGFEIIKSVRLLDRTKVEKNTYLTAIVAKKKSEIF